MPPPKIPRLMAAALGKPCELVVLYEKGGHHASQQHQEKKKHFFLQCTAYIEACSALWQMLDECRALAETYDVDVILKRAKGLAQMLLDAVCS